MPKSITLEDFYKSDAYCSHQGVKKGLFGRAYEMVQRLMLTRKKQLLSKWIPRKASLLDFGCGVGDFLLSLRALIQLHWNRTSFQSRKEARSKGLDVFPPWKRCQQVI